MTFSTNKEARELRQARAIAKGRYHEPTSDELRIARHMAQNGASWKEIAKALGWKESTTYQRLSKLGIFVRNRAKYGIETTFPGLDVGISQNSYKPKKL